MVRNKQYLNNGLISIDKNSCSVNFPIGSYPQNFHESVVECLVLSVVGLVVRGGLTPLGALGKPNLGAPWGLQNKDPRIPDNKYTLRKELIGQVRFLRLLEIMESNLVTVKMVYKYLVD